jgi:hypothetical protein
MKITIVFLALLIANFSFSIETEFDAVNTDVLENESISKSSTESSEIITFKRMVNSALKNSYYEKRLKVPRLEFLREKVREEKENLRLKLQNDIYLKYLATNNSIFRDFLPMRF